MDLIHIAPVYGLVLVGGKSSRMGKSKWELIYHGKNQLEHCFDLLSPFCEKVLISSRSNQRFKGKVKTLPRIEDRLNDMGPVGGLHAAMSRFPGVAWLILACDMPFIDHETILTLCSRRNPKKFATAFFHQENGLVEPLCTIYEPHAFIELEQAIIKKELTGLARFLSKLWVERIEYKSEEQFLNINTPDGYRSILEKIVRNSQFHE